MKKSTLFVMMAGAVLSASAQYTIDPTTETVLAQGPVSAVQYIGLDEASIAAFEAQGAVVESFAPNNADRNLWIWPDGSSFTAGDSSYPGVGMHFDGYASFEVGSIGWSGAGYAIAEPGVNTTMWTDATRFHLAYRSPATICPSVGIIIADGTDIGSTPAKVALGAAYNDNGTIFPSIAPAATDEWQGIDISFADLKKVWPLFSYKAVEAWLGNIMSFVCGATTGQSIAFDAVYYYNRGEAGIEAVEAENDWVVTGNTVNVKGNAGIELYNLAGQKVKATAGSTLGLDNLASGVYVARSGNQVCKVVK